MENTTTTINNKQQDKTHITHLLAWEVASETLGGLVAPETLGGQGAPETLGGQGAPETLGGLVAQRRWEDW